MPSVPGRMWLMLESGAGVLAEASVGAAGSDGLMYCHWCVTKFSLNGMVYCVDVEVVLVI